jgi:hypothetical protein
MSWQSCAQAHRHMPKDGTYGWIERATSGRRQRFAIHTLRVREELASALVVCDEMALQLGAQLRPQLCQ